MKKRRPIGLWWLVLVLTVVGGCGDSGTESGPETASVDLTGVWVYGLDENAYEHPEAGTISCRIDDRIVLELEQDGRTLTGSATETDMVTCTVDNAPPYFADAGRFPAGPVRGVVDGASVQFDVYTTDWAHSGTATNQSVTGTAHITIDLEEYNDGGGMVASDEVVLDIPFDMTRRY